MKFREYLKEIQGTNLPSRIRIVKNWKFQDNINSTPFKIEINDSHEHPILDRIKSRTEVKVNDMNFKLQRGIDYILKKDSNNFFKKDVEYIELKYTKSNFKVIFMLKTKDKYLRISSIFSPDMDVKNAIRWDIKEFYNEFPEYVNILNENISCDFFTINDYFMVEVNEFNNSHDVMLSDPNDVMEFEIDI